MSTLQSWLCMNLADIKHTACAPKSYKEIILWFWWSWKIIGNVSQASVLILMLFHTEISPTWFTWKPSTRCWCCCQSKCTFPGYHTRVSSQSISCMANGEQGWVQFPFFSIIQCVPIKRKPVLSVGYLHCHSSFNQTIYTELQKKLTTSSGWCPLKSTLSKLINICTQISFNTP